MKPVQANTQLIGHRSHSQLCWSQNSEGDMVAHVRHDQSDGPQAARMGVDQIGELIRFRGRNLIQGNCNIEHPLFTDEKSATLNFKILSESPGKNAVLLPASAKYQTAQQQL